MRRELGEPPPRADVVATYLAMCAELLGRTIVQGELRADELALAEELDARFATREWLEEGGGLRRPGVRIHEGVRVGEGAHKAPGGLIRCIATVRDDRLHDAAFSGDFTALPASVPDDLEGVLVDSELGEAALLSRVTDYYERVHPEIPGVGPSDWVAAVLLATTQQVPA
jgi:lipoate-protein ligase A